MSLERLLEPPDDTFGYELGQDDWRFIVEMLLPDDGASLWGVATWNGASGDGVWSESVWTDVTNSVAGVAWRRGSDQYGDRPRTGTLNLTLRVEGDNFSPFGTATTKAYFAPGTLVRISCVESSTGEWVPQFCGVVDAWPQDFAQITTHSTVTVSAVETTAFLAQIDDNATSTVGTGDDVVARITRLLTAAEWPYSVVAETKSATFQLQSTDMADNRLSEIHLSADSADCVFYSHRSGIGLIREADPRMRPEGDHVNSDPALGSAAAVMFPERVEFNQGTTAAAAPWADLDATEHLQIPDAANLDFTGNFTVVVQLDGSIPSTSGIRALASKWGTLSTDQSWRFGVNGTGNFPVLSFRATVGADQTLTGPTPLPDGPYPMWVGAAFDAASSGIVRFFVRHAHHREWSALGGTIGSAATLRTTTTAVRIGDPVEATGVGVATRYRGLMLWDSITSDYSAPTTDPLIELVPDDFVVNDSNVSSFVCKSGQTVTITGTGVLTAQTGVRVDANTPVVIANDREAIINDVRISRAGGSEQVVTDPYSRGRWKKWVTFSRNDLLNTGDADVLTIANRILDRRSRVTLRPTSVTVVSRRGLSPSNLPALFVLDVGDVVTVRLPGSTTRVVAAVAAVDHQVALGNWWQATYTFDVFSEIA
jgi:hypothetical protein